MKPKHSLVERQRLLKKIVAKKLSVASAAQIGGVTRTVIYRWLAKYQEEIGFRALAKKKDTTKILQASVMPGKGTIRRRPSYSLEVKIRAVEEYKSKKRSATSICNELNISKTILYRWLKRYQTAGSRSIINSAEAQIVAAVPVLEKELSTKPASIASTDSNQNFDSNNTRLLPSKFNFDEPGFDENRALAALENKVPRGFTHPKQTSSQYEQLILEAVSLYPELSSHELVKVLPTIGTNPVVGNHGVQNVLRRNDLNTYEKRALFAATYKKTPFVFNFSFKSFLAMFSSIAKLPFRMQNTLYSGLISFFIPVTISVVLLGMVNYVEMYAAAGSVGVGIGYVFASFALMFGMFFFLYSAKYYISVILVLIFSRQILPEKRDASDALTGWNKSMKPSGLIPDLSEVRLTRQPFVSIHLPLYNEKRVVNRLLEAVTSMEYDQFEVIVCDDSTDETKDIVNEWRNHPKIKISHRDTRSGFKGAALKEATKLMDPRTEFVVIFDADFLPYPDSVTQFLKYFQTLAGSLEQKVYTKSKIAAVQGYQWHVLNKSENWITRGVRSEYAGSYVIERSSAEIYGGLKQIAGSVYMIRTDVMNKMGWGDSITEDFEMTLRLYSHGYQVAYTPYIQAPSECVSTLKRLVRQRMRWAEGHSFNIKKHFWKILLSKDTSIAEKIEIVYLTPYYLQSFFFLLGTLSWFIAEAIFQVRLPFWTAVWGWSLVLTNMLSLPLMNLVGMFLEEAEEKDFLGLFSFILLTYIVAPFQAYAAVKGFLEAKEGPWFRTPKTGKITDVFKRGRFYRWLSAVFPTGQPAATATSNRVQFASMQSMFGKRSQRVRIANMAFAITMSVFIFLASMSPYILEVEGSLASVPEMKTAGQGVFAGDQSKDQNSKDAKNPDNKNEILQNALATDITTPRLIERKDAKGNLIQFVFHKDPRVRIINNGQEIEFTTNQIGNQNIRQSSSKVYQDRTVIYADVIEGADLKYTINDHVLVEELIVKNRTALSKIGNQIHQRVRVSGIQVVSENPDNFAFFMPSGEEIFQFSQPFMQDAKGQKSTDVSYSLTKDHQGYQLQKNLGESAIKWLDESNREFPVSIDPSVVVSGGASDTEAQFGSMQRKVASFARSGGVKIDDAGDPGAIPDSGARLVRTSAGVLYAVNNDGGDIEVWSSTDAVTWTEQDSADGPTDLSSSDEVAIAIDSSDVIHIAYVNDDTGGSDEDVDYITFTTSTNQFGTDETAINTSSTNGQVQRGLDLTIDSNDVPHIVSCEFTNNNRIYYANRVGGSWNADVQPDTGQSYLQASIVVNEDDLPEIAFLGGTDGLVAGIGDANNATSFTKQTVDSGAITTPGVRGVDISIDTSGNSWIVYVDETGATDYVTLVKHNDSDSWATWQTPVNNTNAGVEPALAIADSNIYIVYADENSDVAWDRYNGSWLGETVRRSGTFQDVGARSAYNAHSYKNNIDLLYSDGTDIYWDSLHDNFYTFTNESGDVSYKKSTDGGVQWNTAVTVDDGDTDNYNPSIAVSNSMIFTFWVDDGAEQIEGRRIDTSSSDTQGTLCKTSPQSSIGSTFMVTVAKFSDTAAMVAFSDTGSDSEVDMYSLTALDGTCAGGLTSVLTGSIPFGTQGSGLTAGDRPVLVPLTSTTMGLVFQDGDLSYSQYFTTNGEWTRNNQTIASVNHNVYSVTSNGTTIWALVLDTSQNDDALLYSFPTASTGAIESTTIDADVGASSSDMEDSSLDMYCVAADDCKIVFVNNLDTTAPDLMFVDCDNASCSSNTTVNIDSDVGDASVGGNPRIYCVASDNCKILYGDMGVAAPDAVFVDCSVSDCDNAGTSGTCASGGRTCTILDTDLGAADSEFFGDIYCIADDNCKAIYFNTTDETNDVLFFEDCSDATCATNTTTNIAQNFNNDAAYASVHMSIYCVSDTDCKVLYHDAVDGDLTMIDCGNAACSSQDSGSPSDIDTDVGGTTVTVPNSIDCSPGSTDCKIVYTDSSQFETNFVDCADSACTSSGRTTTKLDDTAGGNGSDVGLGNEKVGIYCISATDCKGTWSDSSTYSYFFDCDSATCDAGSAEQLVTPAYGSAIDCVGGATDCKLVYYDKYISSGDAPITFTDCTNAKCMPDWSDASDPWTGQTQLEGVSITYDSTNADLYAHVIKDSSDQAYFKSTDATTISWGTEYSYNFTAGDLGQISATEVAAGFAQIGVLVRQGTNVEFSTLPENTWVILIVLPAVPGIFDRWKRRKRAKRFIA